MIQRIRPGEPIYVGGAIGCRVEEMLIDNTWRDITDQLVVELDLVDGVATLLVRDEHGKLKLDDNNDVLYEKRHGTFRVIIEHQSTAWPHIKT